MLKIADKRFNPDCLLGLENSLIAMSWLKHWQSQVQSW